MDNSLSVSFQHHNSMMDASTTLSDVTEPPLFSVPIEVLLQIASDLTTPEYGNLRLTCKYIEGQLLNSFSREFFTKRQFMFTEFSLQALVDISESRFSPSLRHVIISLERPFATPSNYTNFTAFNDTTEKRQKSNCTLQESIDHSMLLSTGQGVEMIAHALSSLNNLETIGMRDFYSHSRRRDSIRQWRSYGVRTYFENTDHRMEFPQTYIGATNGFRDQASYLNQSFLNILRALGKAGSQPTTFEVILRHSSLNDSAFYIPKWVESTVHPVLTNLRTLFLDLNSTEAEVWVDDGTNAVACTNYRLTQFLSKLSRLEHLRLNFRISDREVTQQVLLWLSKPAPATMPSPSTPLPPAPIAIDFPNLRRLDIGMTSTTSKILIDIARKFQPTLRVISLHKITLTHDDSLGAPRQKVNLWASFFRELSRLNLNLTGINMSELNQLYSRNVIFRDSRNPRKRNWGGTNTQSGLKDFADSVEVEDFPEPKNSVHSNEEEDTNSDEEEEEEEAEEDEDEEEGTSSESDDNDDNA